MLDRWEKPGLYHRPVPFVIFSTAKRALLVGYFVLFWLAADIFAALGAVAFHFIFGSIVLRKFFPNRVAIWYPHMVDAVRGGQREGAATVSEAKIQGQALSLAKTAAQNAMRNEQ